MNETLSEAAQITVIAGFICAAFSYVVLRPLNNSIGELKNCIREMREDLSKERERREALYHRLVICEHDVKAAHKRLDSLGAKPPYVIGDPEEEE